MLIAPKAAVWRLSGRFWPFCSCLKKLFDKSFLRIFKNFYMGFSLRLWDSIAAATLQPVIYYSVALAAAPSGYPAAAAPGKAGAAACAWVYCIALRAMI